MTTRKQTHALLASKPGNVPELIRYFVDSKIEEEIDRLRALAQGLGMPPSDFIAAFTTFMIATTLSNVGPLMKSPDGMEKYAISFALEVLDAGKEAVRVKKEITG